MQVFVVDNKNRPLMPCKARKAKKLLRKGFASVKLLTPFAICLKNASNGTTVHNSVSYKKLTLLEKSKTLLINKKRSGISFPCLKTGISMPSF